MQNIKAETETERETEAEAEAKERQQKKQKETNKMAKLIAIALLGHFPKNFVTGFCSFRDTHTHQHRSTHTRKEVNVLG